MTNRSQQNSLALALAVTTPCLAGLWLISVPQTVAPSISTSALALLVALVGTTISLYGSGQATGSMGQWLRSLDTAPLSAAGVRPASGSGTRSGS